MERAPPNADLDAPQQRARALLADDGTSVFRDGFYSPSLSTYGSRQQELPWKSVREVMAMADNALKAKQRAAEKLLKQLEVLQQQGANENLLKRAQRAEVDCGSLLDELQQLIQAKADVAQQHADLDRANALLMAERQLLCQQLQVSPESVNLCQAVSRVLATAKRAKGLDAQLRLLAKCQRELLLQLEGQREATSRTERQWQAQKQALLQLLAEHDIKAPELPELPHTPAVPLPVPAAAAGESTAADTAAAAEPAAGLTASGSLNSSSSAALMAQLMLMRMHSAGASCPGADMLSDSSHVHLPPGTPPVQDLALAGATRAVPVLHRSHSLDSGLNSLTGLLDQLALGQLCGSEDGTDTMYDDTAESESWALMDTLSADTELWCGPAVTAAAGTPTTGGGSSSSLSAAAAGLAAKEGHQHVHQHHQHPHLLQPVQEAPEDC